MGDQQTQTQLPRQVVWFLTGSQGLYGDDVLGQVAEQSRGISDALDASDALPLPVVARPVLTDADAMRRVLHLGDLEGPLFGVLPLFDPLRPAHMLVTPLDLLSQLLLHLFHLPNNALHMAR